MWPTWSTPEVNHDVLKDLRSEQKSKIMYEVGLLSNTTDFKTPLEIDETRFSSLTKLLRVTALALRFIQNLRCKGSTESVLTAQELFKARTLWERYIQQRSFANVIQDIKLKRNNNFVTQLDL